MSDWKEATLGQITSVITKGTTPTTLGLRFTDDGVNFVKVESISDGGSLLPEKFAHIDHAAHEALARSQLNEGDILFSIAGAIGRTTQVDAAILPANTNQALAIIRVDPSAADPRYVYYYLRSTAFQQHGLERVVQTAQANVSLGVLRNAPIHLPPRHFQQRVVAILTSIDDLIENNRRRIVLLEQMAQAIYREWFVYFRYPGHEDDDLVDSPLGPIPAGWEVTSLGNHAASLVDGDWIETKDQGGSDYRLLQVSNVGLGSFRETGNFRYITAETFDRLRCTEIRLGDILISRMPDPVGRAWLVDFLDCPAVTAVDVAILTPPSPESGLFLSYWLNASETLAQAEACATGTTRKRVTRSVLGRFDLVLPADWLLSRFFSIARPMADEAAKLRRQGGILAMSRDLLLPKLVTGAIDVSLLDLDGLLEESAA